jgi:hypothetical protein
VIGAESVAASARAKRRLIFGQNRLPSRNGAALQVSSSKSSQQAAPGIAPEMAR